MGRAASGTPGSPVVFVVVRASLQQHTGPRSCQSFRRVKHVGLVVVFPRMGSEILQTCVVTPMVVKNLMMSVIMSNLCFLFLAT